MAPTRLANSVSVGKWPAGAGVAVAAAGVVAAVVAAGVVVAGIAVAAGVGVADGALPLPPPFWASTTPPTMPAAASPVTAGMMNHLRCISGLLNRFGFPPPPAAVGASMYPHSTAQLLRKLEDREVNCELRIINYELGGGGG